MQKSILVCDDSVFVLSGLNTLLTKSGNWDAVYSAANGRDGLEFIKEYKPDIICLDIEMSGRDGFRVMKEIWKLKKAGTLSQNSRVVALGGSKFENVVNVRKAKSLGAFCVLPKPVDQASTKDTAFREIEKELLKAAGE